MTRRALSAEEQRLWGAVMATVRPLRAATVPAKPARDTAEPGKARLAMNASECIAKAPPPPPESTSQAQTSKRSTPAQGRGSSRSPAVPAATNTLDGGWDKRLARGVVAPDASIDLHGHTLASAHALLDSGLARSIARGDRVLLLVTGKPPRPESERPHARGAIRAAVADWLAASRHADHIAAVRGAHPRHGGAGALYIVLRRARTPA